MIMLWRVASRYNEFTQYCREVCGPIPDLVKWDSGSPMWKSYDSNNLSTLLFERTKYSLGVRKYSFSDCVE